MKTLFLAVATGAILAPLPADLASTYEAGEVRTTTFSLDVTKELTETSSMTNGVDDGEVDMQQSLSSAKSGVFTDSAVRATEGDLTGFRRTYSDLVWDTSMIIEIGSNVVDEAEDSGESALDGEVVNFALEDGEFVASFDEDNKGADRELLDGLEALLPWGSFLPDAEVEVDDEWELDTKAFWKAVNLGGDLSFVGTLEGDKSSAFLLITGLATNRDLLIDGEITGTLVSQEDGVATIELAIEVTESHDLTEMFTAIFESRAEDMPGLPDVESMTSELEYDGEGTIIWDLEGGYLTSMELSLAFSEVMEGTVTMDMGGQTMEMGQSHSYDGELEFAVEVEVSRGE